MATGKVKWFNNAKGYGFILPDAGGDDLFAHYSTILMDGYKTLRSGQAVTFEVEAGPKGLHAVEIRASDIACAVIEGASGREYRMDGGFGATDADTLGSGSNRTEASPADRSVTEDAMEAATA